MLKLRRETDYAIRCILHLSKRRMSKFSNVSRISDEEEIPSAFVAKILQKLTNGGIVKPIRGKKGGYALLLPPNKITLLKIIEIMEGLPQINVCLTKEGACKRSKTCPFHKTCKEIQANFIKCLKSYNFTKILKNTGEQ